MVRVSEPVYFIEALWRLRSGATFDEVRFHLLEIQHALVEDASRRRLSGNRHGRAAGSTDRHAMWTTARDVLIELRTLGLIPRDLAVPTTKTETEAARNRPYHLSPAGTALLPLVERRHEDFAAFDRLFLLQMSTHDEMRSIWAFLRERGRLLIPTCNAKLSRGDASRWLRDAREALNAIEQADPAFTGISGMALVRLEEALSRKPDPSAKLAAQWLDEAVGNAALHALGLKVSYISTESLAVLLSRYFVAGRTFHHPTIHGQLIYPIAEIDPDGNPPITRRRYSDVREEIRREILTCLNRYGPGQHPVWKVRAEVAYALKVSDTVVDRALAELRHDRHPGSPRLAFLSDFVGALPPSASPLIVGREVFYQIAVLLPRPEDAQNARDAA